MQSLVIIVAIGKTPRQIRFNYVFPSELSIICAVVASRENFMLAKQSRRRTQVVKGEVCKTSMQRFESARRLQISFEIVDDSQSTPSSHQKNVPVLFQLQWRN